MQLTVWLQKGNELVAPKSVNVARYTVSAISEAYFGVAYHGAFSYAGDIPHSVVYTEPEKIGTNEGSATEWLYFPESEAEMKRMKKLYQVEPLPSHERRKLSVEAAQ